MSSAPIKLIVGLGNPGPEHINTRHNAGAWVVERLCEVYKAQLTMERKFKGAVAKIQIDHQDIWLLFPTTFMNLSGEAVLSLAHFYKILPDEILVAHDELDFSPGIARFKQGGGHGGHNGLRSIIERLGSNQFARLRIGIGRPQHSSQVLNYVLQRPSKDDEIAIDVAIDQVLKVLANFVGGEREAAVKALHTAA